MTPPVIKNFLSRLSATIPIFLYSILAVILTYPLITKLASHLSGAGQDAYISFYNYWWFKFSLTNGLNIFSSPLLLYPGGANLALATSTFSSSLIISVFDLFFPPLIAFNLFILFSFVLSAWGTYQLLKYLFKNKLAAFLGGLFFAFHPYIFYELGVGHFNYTITWFIPFFILFLLKATREKTKKYFNAALAALFLTLGFYNDLYYAFGLLFVLIIPVSNDDG